jgi:16S rRNA (adenine1518-N6/adenine1519-N6)-dimethyltransferase
MYRIRKSLGQHFLVDENISRKIVDHWRNRGFAQVLEIGPGAGALTKYLAELPELDFRAVEIDEEKAEWLQDRYPGLSGRIIRGNFLEMERPFGGAFSILGNFPYNISSQILFRILDWKQEVPYVLGMFQKEVAQRLAAGEGSKTYGVLSVIIQAFYQVRILFEVNEQSFRPAPKVKSAVIELIRREKPASMKNEQAFQVLVKTAFNQRRKTLRNAVRSLFDADFLADPLFNRRAEQLPVEEFGSLTFQMR